jgi:transposase
MGALDRLILSDRQWERIAGHVPGRLDTRGANGRDNRMFVEGVPWIVRTGSPWRDLPEASGSWNSAFRRFRRWSAKGVWRRIFAAMAAAADFEYRILDSTIAGTRQHAAGAKKGLEIRLLALILSLPKDARGWSTKIHIAVRGLGCRVRIILTAGRRGDVPPAAALLDGQRPAIVMADTAYDADRFRAVIAAAGAIAVIPNNPSRAAKLPFDTDLLKDGLSWPPELGPLVKV